MAKLKKLSSELTERVNEGGPVIVELSTEAKANLEKLQLRSLDKQGRQPGPAQIIERLINAAARSEPEAFYPA